MSLCAETQRASNATHASVWRVSLSVALSKSFGLTASSLSVSSASCCPRFISSSSRLLVPKSMVLPISAITLLSVSVLRLASICRASAYAFPGSCGGSDEKILKLLRAPKACLNFRMSSVFQAFSLACDMGKPPGMACVEAIMPVRDDRASARSGHVALGAASACSGTSRRRRVMHPPPSRAPAGTCAGGISPAILAALYWPTPTSTCLGSRAYRRPSRPTNDAMRGLQ